MIRAHATKKSMTAMKRTPGRKRKIERIVDIAILLSRIERTKGGEYDSFVYLLCLLAVCRARFPHLDLAHEQELCPQDGRHDDQGPRDLGGGGAQIGGGGGKTG